MKNLIGYLLIAFFVTGVANYFTAAEHKEAHVTEVIKDVSVLAKNASRAAVVNELVGEGNAVRTGTDSRAELTFADATLARVGANSVFSFGAGGKEFNLSNGAMLLAAPKAAGTVKVNTAAVTAAVTGFTAMFEAHKKVAVLEGECCVRRKGHPNEPCTMLHAGDLLILDNGRFDRKKIDVQKVMKTALLVTQFKNKLPAWSLKEITLRNSGPATGGTPPGGYYNDQAGNNAAYQRNNSTPPPPPPKPASSQPPQPSQPPSPPGFNPSR